MIEGDPPSFVDGKYIDEKTELNYSIGESVSIETILSLKIPWSGLFSDKRETSKIKIATTFLIKQGFSFESDHDFGTAVRAYCPDYVREEIEHWPDQGYKDSHSALVGHCKTIKNIKRTYTHYTRPLRMFIQKYE